tara:strand:- start:1484 stop:2785 length:1302 start_codon:yes stop_codon:yes gene_type:complete
MSTVKVNKITPRTCNSIQLGESGDTLTIPSGATLQNCGTATGFGISFCSTVKTSPFTATAEKGFFINTGSAVTVTLPASPSTGDELIVIDSTGQAATNNITLGRNGSKIQGQCIDAKIKVNRGGARIVYSGCSQGWITATAGNETAPALDQTLYVTATGGTETTSGDFKIHTFNSDANFVVSCAGNSLGSDKVSYIVVAGGAGGGRDAGGGGGAGGFREGKCSSDPYADSPLDAGTGLSVPAATYPITVGAGGAGGASSSARGTSGSPSTFSTITSAGGGGGGSGGSGVKTGADGGSGGGGRAQCNAGGSGNTPPVSPPQGNNGGGPAPGNNSAAGGGATAAGANGGGSIAAGGTGATTSINASPTAFAGGGGGSSNSGCIGSTASSCGTGGTHGANGTTNRGGGGGGEGVGDSGTAGTGGSGVVIIRYKFQN